jgi:hypothetical protein
MPNNTKIARLSRKDKKVLKKYTKLYTNFIESPTAINKFIKKGQNVKPDVK